MAGKQKGLGRGLDALIKDGATKREEAETGKTEGAQRVSISQVVASPWQPRSIFDSNALGELVESVRYMEFYSL